MSTYESLDDHSVSSDQEVAKARRMHDRSGEIELIISGALLFSLLQVPGVLNETMDGMMPRLSESQFVILFFVVFYVKLMAMTLIASFTLHLVARAYWVGLIGLDSVFPEGIDWSRIRYGPWAKEVYAAHLPSLPRMARRADSLGSTIFSFAFWIIVLFLFSVVAGAIVGGVWWSLRATLLPDLGSLSFFVGISALALIPTVAIGIDKFVDGRLAPTSRLARTVKRTILVAYQVTGGPLFMPIQFTLFSRVPKKVMWPLFIGVFAALLFGLLTTEFVRVGTFAVSASEYVPSRPGPRSVSDEYFADTRDPSSTVPFIETDVVTGPYVRLTVPLVAMRAFDRVRENCPELAPVGRVGLVEAAARSEVVDDGYEAALLACFARVWTIRLDGTALSPDWDLRWSSATGVTAIVTYIATEGLSPGAHVLEVEEIPAAGDPAAEPREGPDDDPPAPRIDYIRFRI